MADESKMDALSEDEPQLVKKEEKRKPAPPPKVPRVVALKTSTHYLEGAEVNLVKDEEIEGLTSQELDHLLFHGFVKLV